MSPRPPADAAVVLRSLPRRFRALFAGLGDDESPDALARRSASDGTSPLGHLVAATATVTSTARALNDALTHDDPVVAPITAEVAALPDGTLEERQSELAWEADALADRVERTSADEWGRRARLGSDADVVSAVDLLWRGVDDAVARLKSAERTLTEVRQAR